jgi:hypothetical protein
MPIRFKCPNPVCRKPLVVKDHLAGKKAACPACKKPLTVPAAVAAPADIEAFAAAALTDAPAASRTGEHAQTIRLECPFCAEQVEFDRALGGKQAPCPNPECRRIVKVPMPAEAKAADWRQAASSGPLGARDNVQKAVEAQEAANLRMSRVSLEALEEAGALPVEQELVPTSEKVKLWIRRVTVTIVALGVVALSWSWLNRKRQESRENQALQEVRKTLNTWANPESPEIASLSEAEKEVIRVRSAALRRALGAFHVRDPQTGKALEEARREFVRARAEADSVKDATLRDLLLTDLAISQIKLGGTPEQIDNKVRMKWDDVQTELSRTLEKISSQEGQVFALREVAGQLLQRDQDKIAIGLAVQLGRSANLLTSQQVALLLATNEAARAATILKEPGKAGDKLDLATRLGYAEGKARLGDFHGATKLVQEEGRPLDRLQAALGVAAVGLQIRNTPAARANLEVAIGLLDGELKNAQVPALLLWQTARLAARLGTLDQVKSVVARIQDAECAARAELEILFSRFDDGTPADADLVSNRKTLAYAQALEQFARFRTRQGDSKVIELMTNDYEEGLRAFLWAGIALGEKDRR